MSKDKNNLITLNKQFKEALTSRRVSLAIARLRMMCQLANVPWLISSKLDSVEESYRYLCKYAIDGMIDPEREEVLEDIDWSLRQISSAIMRHADVVDSSRLYFATIRYENMQTSNSIAELLSQYLKQYAELNNRLFMPGKSVDHVDRSSLEALQRRIFNRIWTTYPLSVDDVATLEQVASDKVVTDDFKEHLVSALTIGGLEYFDESRMVLLAKLYLSSSKAVQVKALVGLLICIWMHRDCLGGRKFKAVMSTVFEQKGWCDDLRMVFMELVRTRDTERISQTLNNEVIPEMMKLRPDILRKIDESNLSSAEELLSADENPEWAEMLEKSGIGDKIKELNELMADGGDVMMTTFGHLKNFSFFNDVSNWFLPFSVDHTAVSSILSDSAADIGQIIESSPMMCDSDKYSIIFSLDKIPSASRRSMLSQFNLSNINLAELKASELNPEINSRKNICNKYIHDIYRFYKLFRRKGEFPNPFETPINLASIAILAPFIDDSDALTAVGEFYFSRGYYAEALDVFRMLLESDSSNVAILQKAGFCCQKINQRNDALQYYHRSELLRPDSVWTLRHIAQCYRSIGQNDKALTYYQTLSKILPDDLKIAMNLGHCLLESGAYADALKQYHKVEFLSSDTEKALRPIAWCLLLSGDLSKSREYYDRIMSDKAEKDDFINYGHLLSASGEYRKAIEHYNRAVSLVGIEGVVDSINNDRQILHRLNVDNSMINIIIDSLDDR